MVPAGDVVEKNVTALAALLEPGDTIIDGGNSFYKKHPDVHFIDVGTSGGTWGLERGYSLMIGGERDPVQQLAPIFAALAPGRGGFRQRLIEMTPPLPQSKVICTVALLAQGISSR